MDVQDVGRLRRVRTLVSLGALTGVGAAVVWFGFAAVEASGAQMAAASGMFAALACGWSAAFAGITARLKSVEAART